MSYRYCLADRVFNHEVSNEDIFAEAMQPIINGAVDGGNGTVIAYGYTATGKTYIMIISDESPGMLPLAFKSLFQCIREKPDRQYTIRASYLEIYKDRMVDLLETTGNIRGKKTLLLLEDPSGHFYLLRTMHRANSYTHVSATCINKVLAPTRSSEP
ncbi:kinesin-like protein KIN-7C, mitochondrial [Hyalella azteca]|uniref:Kinesin-like protein KIN-7C, mitochondrial n=1 Tax=Hyalella azteca TaxID=294128 RepID=A0A979FJ26_HYAAZ|nr:kinesin-like protein KIN-7C, mitochondrial [Hyalella azteca]